MNKTQVGAWALFDFANSVYPAVMTTAVFPVFFILTVVGSEGAPASCGGVGPSRSPRSSWRCPRRFWAQSPTAAGPARSSCSSTRRYASSA